MRNGGASNAGQLAHQIAEIYLREQLTEPAAVVSRPAIASGRRGRSPNRASPAELADYVGRYYSSELDTTYAVEAAVGALRAGPEGAAPMTLRPIEADVFRNGSRTLRFRREAGRITGFTLDGGRVKGLVFVRTP
jgi:hypothetical protein